MSKMFYIAMLYTVIYTRASMYIVRDTYVYTRVRMYIIESDKFGISLKKLTIIYPCKDVCY